MTRTRLGTVIPILILLLSILSCDLFSKAPKPTQVVDLAPMVGKSLQEMTAMLGPPKEKGICYGWDFPEGEISACYKYGDSAKKSMDSISYRLTPYGGFTTASVGSIEEMAPLVNIDLEGKKPDGEFQGGYAYDWSLNGKTVRLNFDGGPKKIVGVRVHIK